MSYHLLSKYLIGVEGMKKVCLPIVLTSLLLTTACSSTEAKPSQESQSQSASSAAIAETKQSIGTEMGDIFELKMKALDGKDIILPSKAGRPTVVFFWSQDCTSCVKDASILAKLADANKAQVDVIAVNTGKQSASEVSVFAKKNKLKFPNVADETGEVSKKLNGEQAPVTFFLDGTGTILMKLVGQATEKDFTDGFKMLSGN